MNHSQAETQAETMSAIELPDNVATELGPRQNGDRTPLAYSLPPDDEPSPTAAKNAKTRVIVTGLVLLCAAALVGSTVVATMHLQPGRVVTHKEIIAGPATPEPPTPPPFSLTGTPRPDGPYEILWLADYATNSAQISEENPNSHAETWNGSFSSSCTAELCTLTFNRNNGDQDDFIFDPAMETHVWGVTGLDPKGHPWSQMLFQQGDHWCINDITQLETGFIFHHAIVRAASG